MAQKGELFTIPKGVKVWSIDLQEVVMFEKNIIVKVNNTCHGSDYVFVKKQELFGNCIGMIPGLGETKVEFGVSASKLKPYRLPEPIGF